MQINERYQLWSDFLENYKEYFKDLDEIWMEHFENLKKFIDINNRKPKQKSIGVLNSIDPPHIVANQLKILIPVGTAIIIVAAVK
jgi:hypothetical protein